MVFTPTTRAGRPAPPQPVVDLDARAPAGGSREGPGSSVKRRADHPVVHVAHEDAARLRRPGPAPPCPPRPSGSTPPAAVSTAPAFTWGDEARPGGRIMANTWDGPDFPWRSTRESGWLRTSPVGSFPANGFGLFDMAGNVWEWTDDWWTSRHPDDAGSPCCAPDEPARRRRSRRATTRPSRSSGSARKVIKGGSHLCADTYCLRYRPAARRPQMIDTGMSHVGLPVRTRDPPPRRQEERHDRPTLLPSWRPGADPRRRPRLPRRGADASPRGPGRLLRQRRHAVVRAPDLRPVRLLRRRARDARSHADPDARRDARVRRPAHRRPGRHRRARAWRGSRSP